VELSIVLPAYEEAENLRVLLPQLREVMSSLSSSGEILVVDAASPRDDTPEICSLNKVRYVPRTGGSYYGDAIRTAVRNAMGKYVILMDADGSHDPGFVAQLWPFREEFDVVIASRYVSGGKTDNPPILIFLSLVVNVVFRLVLSLNCRDVSNSFRLYQGDQFRALKLECTNFDIVEEMLIKLQPGDRSLRIKEIPFTFQKRKEGKTKRDLVAFAMTYVVTLLRLYRMKHAAKTPLRQGAGE
jgi:dolichol-phosphate mannosyltransferase